MLRLNAYRGPDQAPGARRARAGGLARQVALGRGQPVAERARAGPGRARGRSSSTTRGPTATCARAPTRSRAGRPRSSRTSSPSACSGCRGRNELRPHRRPAGHQAHRARVPRRALQARGGPAAGAGGGARLHRRAVGRDRAARLAGAGRARSRARRRRAGRGGRGARLRVRADAAAARRGRRRCCSMPRARRGGSPSGRRGTVAQWDEDTDGDPERSSLGDDLRGREDRGAGRGGGRPDRGDRVRGPALRGRRRRRRDRAGRDARHHAAAGDGAARRAARRRSSPAATTRSPAPGTRSRS